MCEPNEPPGKRADRVSMWAAVQAAVMAGWPATLRLGLIMVILIVPTAVSVTKFAAIMKALT